MSDQDTKYVRPVEHEWSAQNRTEGRAADFMCGCPKGELLGPCEHSDPAEEATGNERPGHQVRVRVR